MDKTVYICFVLTNLITKQVLFLYPGFLFLVHRTAPLCSIALNNMLACEFTVYSRGKDSHILLLGREEYRHLTCNLEIFHIHYLYILLTFFCVLFSNKDF